MESLDSEAPTPIVEIPYNNSGSSAGNTQIDTSPRVSKKKLAKLTGLIQVVCGVLSIICSIVIFCVPEIKLRDVYNVFEGLVIGGPIIGYVVLTIFSSLNAVLQLIQSISTLIDTDNCYPDEGGTCDLTKNEDGSRLNNSHGSPFANDFSATPVPNLESSDDQAYPIIPRTELDLIKQIGHGAYSEVYLAKWNNHDVAAKRLHEECRLEAEFLARLDHPNIVKLIGVVDEKFDFFLVLELCDGGSLRSYLNDHKQQPLGLQFYDWAKQTARPIKYLKEKKIVHKDIKSPNYLLVSSGALKLGDFGLAKNVDITISRATETASYPWMAPELLRDNILSPKYDVFAYGIVLWELWTRQMPFEDVVEPAHLAWRICNDNERPQIPADCPKSVADLMRLCWETDWKMRPNMEEVLSQLASAEEEAIENLSK